ncbi:MAG: hypothetical protein Q9160_006268 [Pyrenula sp. 1 TL-2023]
MTTQTISKAALKLDLWQPTFEDIPKYATYLARREQLNVIGTCDQSLPNDFKAVYDHASAWSGQTIEPDAFLYNLTEEDVAEIEHACEDCKRMTYSKPFYLVANSSTGSISSLNDVNPETFHLPSLGCRLRQLGDEVYDGRGLVLLRGLQPDKFSQYDNVLMYKGVTSYIAPDVGVQGPEKDLLSWQLLNGVQNNTMLRPILYPTSASRPLMLFSRRNLTGCYQAQRSATAPILSDRQIDALDAIHFAAQKHSFSIPQRKGDIILFNNMAVLHARENFPEQPTKSDPEPGLVPPSDPASSAAVVPSDRHLMRLWLRDERRGTRIPHELQHIWEIVYGEESVKKGIWDLEGRHSHSTILNESDASTVG